MYDLIIIGGGPAGITAGIYAARQRVKTLLITKDFGGQMTQKAVMVENYPGFEEISGAELSKKFEEHLKSEEQVCFEIDEVSKIEKVGDNFLVATDGKKEFSAKSVIVASGVNPVALSVPGEKEFIGRGVSYCVLCDGPLFLNKIVR